jgi:hypothetical protein
MQRYFSLIKFAAGLVLAALLPFLASSCSKRSDNVVSNFTMTSEEVFSFMFIENGIDVSTGYGIKDTLYVCPDEDWLNGRFSKIILPQYLVERRASTWVAESNDCDDFAEHAKVLMNEIHHNTKHKVPNTGVLFGVVWYTRDIGGSHAINWAIVRDKVSQKPKLVFFEPQNSVGIIKLSKKEISSISFWYVNYEKDPQHFVALSSNSISCL